nr:hypothetical protein [uncultured Anaerosporobacter sp.]
MKKRIILLMLVLITTLVGCGKTEKADSRTLDDFVNAFEDEGYEFEIDKPIYSLINAEDGVIFYIGNSAVKIYQYKSGKELENAKKEIDLISEWLQNGKFLLETNSEEAKEIFNSVE